MSNGEKIVGMGWVKERLEYQELQIVNMTNFWSISAIKGRRE